MKRKYAKAIERAFAYKTGSQRDIGVKVLKAFSWIFLALGIICWILSFFVLKNNKDSLVQARQAWREKRQAWREKRRQRSRSRSGRKSKKGDSKSPTPIDKVSSAVSDSFSHKSWTSFGSNSSSGNTSSSPDRSVTSVRSTDSKGSRASRLGKLFRKGKN